MKIEFKNPQFITSALVEQDYPTLQDSRGTSLPEVAVCGRSNVGKSTLLNSLFHAKGIVKTSSTPGKTRLINFFTLNRQMTFVDLPGYGFAKGPRDEKMKWGESIETYLQKRKPLKLILFLLDIRHLPSQEDLQMADWLKSSGLPFIIVFTKVDKISANEKERQTIAILDSLAPIKCSYIHTAPSKHEGRNTLMHLICQELFS